MKTKKILFSFNTGASPPLLTACDIDSVISAAGLEPPSRQTERPARRNLPMQLAQPGGDRRGNAGAGTGGIHRPVA